MTEPLPAPSSRERIRELHLRVEWLADGVVRLSTPMARGWAGVSRTPHELARALFAARTEATIAGYAAAHGQVYDLDSMTTTVEGDALAGGPQRRQRGPVARRAAHPPEAWAMVDDGTGRWRSPAGRMYQGSSPTVARVRAARIAKGLPVDTPTDSG